MPGGEAAAPAQARSVLRGRWTLTTCPRRPTVQPEDILYLGRPIHVGLIEADPEIPGHVVEPRPRLFVAVLVGDDCRKRRAPCRMLVAEDGSQEMVHQWREGLDVSHAYRRRDLSVGCHPSLPRSLQDGRAELLLRPTPIVERKSESRVRALHASHATRGGRQGRWQSHRAYDWAAAKEAYALWRGRSAHRCTANQPRARRTCPQAAAAHGTARSPARGPRRPHPS